MADKSCMYNVNTPCPWKTHLGEATEAAQAAAEVYRSRTVLLGERLAVETERTRQLTLLVAEAQKDRDHALAELAELEKKNAGLVRQLHLAEQTPSIFLTTSGVARHRDGQAQVAESEQAKQPEDQRTWHTLILPDGQAFRR